MPTTPTAPTSPTTATATGPNDARQRSWRTLTDPPSPAR